MKKASKKTERDFEHFSFQDFINRQGDLWEDAWHSIYTEAFRTFRYSYEIPEEDCENQAQDKTTEIFTKVYVEREFVETSEGYFAHYVSKMIRDNKSRYFSEKKKLRAEVPIEKLQNIPARNDPIEKITDDMDIRAMALKACAEYLNRLSERDKRILYDRVVEKYTNKEIASSYGLTEGNVRQILRRTRQEMRRIIKKLEKDYEQ